MVSSGNRPEASHPLESTRDNETSSAINPGAHPHQDDHHGDANHSRRRGDSKASTVASMAKDLPEEFEESRPPEGFMATTGELGSTFAAELNQHWHEGVDAEQKNKPDVMPDSADSACPDTQLSEDRDRAAASSDGAGSTYHPEPNGSATDAQHTDPFPNGYHFPPKQPWQETTKYGLLAFWKLFITPWGCFWIIYGFNVVAWGGMLFLLICNAAPGMCHVCDAQGNCHIDCNDINSPRRVWVETDSQILNALFCVTGFGLAPWRFRDLYFLLQYRILGREEGLRRLAGIHRSWYRLPGSQNLSTDVGPDNIPDDVPKSCIPFPEQSIPDAPLTGTRAPPTALWKLDFVIWTMVWNTFFQVALCGCMWGMNRYNRPSWTTGFLVACGCVIAIIGGLMMFFEGKKVKSIEGVPLNERDVAKLTRDKEQGILHYNNMSDKKPKTKVEDLESNTEKPRRRKGHLSANKNN